MADMTKMQYLLFNEWAWSIQLNSQSQCSQQWILARSGNNVTLRVCHCVRETHPSLSFKGSPHLSVSPVLMGPRGAYLNFVLYIIPNAEHHNPKDSLGEEERAYKWKDQQKEREKKQINEQISDASAHCILGNHSQKNNKARLVKSKREALGKKRQTLLSQRPTNSKRK